MILACLVVLSGGLFGEEPDPVEETLACDLEVTRHGAVDETLGFRLKVTLTYQGRKQKMVSRDETLTLIVVTKEGKEIVAESWGADWFRAPSLSDYHMLTRGGGVIFPFGMQAYKEKGLWLLSWMDAFGTYYGCKLETLDGVKLVMKYSSEAKEDFKLNLSKTSTLEVAKEEIWSGTVRSKAVLLK